MCGCYIYDFDCTFETYVGIVSSVFIITCSKVSIKRAHNDQQLSFTNSKVKVNTKSGHWPLNDLRDLSHVSKHQQYIPWVKSFQMIPMLAMLHATCNNAVYGVCHDLTFDLSDMFPHSSHQETFMLWLR